MIAIAWSRSCRRFERLTNDALDRDLTDSELGFVESHRCRCSSCQHREESSAFALNMLRSSAVEPEVDDSYDRRLLRRFHTQTARDGFSYWSPVALGATLAMVGILAALHVALAPDKLPEHGTAASEARRADTGFPAVPDLPSTPKLAP